MAANFTLVPNIVTPEPPEYNTIITQTESMKKEYLSLSETPSLKFKLSFKAITNAVFITIQAHYHSCKGQYDNFSWTSVPSYIDTDLSGTADGSNMTGRWVTDSLKMTPISFLRCNVDITFEKDV